MFQANTQHPLFDEIHNLLLKHIGFDQIIDKIINKLGDLKMVFVVGDFANKIRIALREMRETNYWLRLSEFSFKNEKINHSLLKELISESNELIKILGSILNKCQ